jgi:prepilin-type processing-associated H-X9-DG protein
VNNLRQLGLSLRMYVDESAGRYPGHSDTNRWPNALRDSYRDLHLLVCSSETGTSPGPNTQTNAPNLADASPRSYIINGWNDFYDYNTGGNRYVDMPESVIAQPTDTVVFGEKNYTSAHFYMDLADVDDLEQLDQSKHSSGPRTGNGDGGGGSNFAFADGSTRYLKFGLAIAPINFWAVLPKVLAGTAAP